MRDRLTGPRLERAIGVVYRPETERPSHYTAISTISVSALRSRVFQHPLVRHRLSVSESPELDPRGL
ncbi:hypothetical protein [Bradyrhizobium liaoningense]